MTLFHKVQESHHCESVLGVAFFEWVAESPMDINLFLAPLEGANPSGGELRNDGRFHAIERLMESAARSVRMENLKAGGTTAAAVDWSGVLAQSEELAPSGRDLRLLVIVARAAANAEGFEGLAEGLAMLAGTIDLFWETVHPELRPGGTRAEAALRRSNALYQLENADNGLLGDLEFLPILAPRGLGIVTGGDLAIGQVTAHAFTTEIAPGMGQKERETAVAEHEARVARVAMVCRAQWTEQTASMQALVAGVLAAQAQLAVLEAAMTARIGENGIGFRLSKLEKFLSRVLVTLNTGSAGAASVPGGAAMAPAADASAAAAPGPVPAGGHLAASLQVNTRRDVERMLDLIIEFYERTEPGSPIPHLARRIRKMVPMNFLQLMEEIAPSGIKEFKNAAGVVEEKK